MPDPISISARFAALRGKLAAQRNFLLFLAANAVLGITASIDGAAFNNFLNDSFQITVLARTLIEIPRELPGFLVVFIMGTLMFLGDRRMAVLANVAAGVGMLMLGRFSPTLGVAVFWTFIYSSGQHLFMPLANSIGMSFSDNRGIGRRLGLIGSATTAVFLLSSLVTFFLAKRGGVRYDVLFTVGAVAFVVAAALIALMGVGAKTKTDKKTDSTASGPRPKRFVFRRQYILFYLLSVVHGARKQIFITFGPWVLIKAFDQGVGTFALLGFLIAGLGMLFKPLIGLLIDKRGERFVLIFDAAVLVLVCMGYGLAETAADRLGLPVSVALAVVCGCYVVDQMMTSTGIARATYLRKIAVSMDDVSPTLSMGTSMDHVVSMIIPFCGAFLWSAAGYPLVFLGGAVIAVINILLAMRIKTA